MKLPRSLMLFVMTGIVFLLQLSPYSGIILMVMAAPFWSVLLINFGFVGIAVEAVKGEVPRGWLILPLSWFCGYTGIALADHLALWRLRDAVAALNADVRVPFDPDRQVLVFETIGDAGWLVENYALPVAYARYGNTGPKYIATRVVENAECRKISADQSMAAAGIFTSSFEDLGSSAWGSTFDQRFCDVYQPEVPKLPTLTIVRRENQTSFERLPVAETLTTITLADDRKYTLHGGSVLLLSWVPLPVIGCALNSATPAWQCFAQFQRVSFTSLNVTAPRSESDNVVLAQALGLSRVAPAERHGSDPVLLLANLKATRDALVSGEIAKLDRVLDDPTADIGSLPFGVLRSRLDVILPKMSQIVTTIERGVEMRGNARSNAQQLFGLLQQAPDSELARYRDRFDKLKTKDRWFVFNPEKS